MVEISSTFSQDRLIARACQTNVFLLTAAVIKAYTDLPRVLHGGRDRMDGHFANGNR
jgi:hypothetical protein